MKKISENTYEIPREGKMNVPVNIFVNESMIEEVERDKADNYKFNNDVKAITYNQRFIKFDKDKKQWICQVVLDV